MAVKSDSSLSSVVRLPAEERESRDIWRDVFVFDWRCLGVSWREAETAGWGCGDRGRKRDCGVG